MLLKLLLLGVVYYVGGILLAFAGCATIGMALCTLIALFRIFRARYNWAKLLAFAVATFILLAIVQGILFVAGTIGDHTDYAMQVVLLVGAGFPGIFCLALIPGFARIALTLTAPRLCRLRHGAVTLKMAGMEHNAVPQHDPRLQTHREVHHGTPRFSPTR